MDEAQAKDTATPQVEIAKPGEYLPLPKFACQIGLAPKPKPLSELKDLVVEVSTVLFEKLSARCSIRSWRRVSRRK